MAKCDTSDVGVSSARVVDSRTLAIDHAVGTQVKRLDLIIKTTVPVPSLLYLK